MEAEKSIKSVLGYFGAGLAFVVAVSLTFGTIFSMVGIQLNTDLQAWATAFSTLNPLGIIYGFAGFLIMGAYVWIFAWIGIEIRNQVEGHKGKVELGHRPFLFTLLVTGIFTTLVFYGLGQILKGVSPNVDLSNINTLFSAVMTFNPLFIIGSFLSIALIGYLVARLGRGIPTIDKEVPKQLKPAGL